MGALRPVPFRKLSRALVQVGFHPIRQVGSHVTFAHPDGRKVTVPNHSGHDLGPGLVRAILRETNLTWADIERLL